MEVKARRRKAATVALATASVATAACAPSDRALSPGQLRGIDAVFADMDRSGSPGAAVAVIRDGRIVFSGGYGFAQIEHGVPVTPRTVFHVASVSKQFTAMAVAMLAAEGALSLDDPVVHYLEFVPDLRHPDDPDRRPTVRQMIHHTSGIRDQWQLLAIAGWRLDDVITTAHIRRLMTRQRELNFVPGTEYLYSNMGYTLLAEIVEAKAGTTFGEFTASEIFRPLGMTRTHFHDDHEHIVAGRAYSYAPVEDAPAAGGDAARPEYRKAVLSYANAGATSLFTTAEDLALWLDNFRSRTVGGPRVAEMTTARGVLAGGDTIPYALGLATGEYRGLQTIGHGGADAGFRTNATWFPEALTGVVVLANSSVADPAGRARQVADIVLADVFPEPRENPDEPEADADSESNAEPEPAAQPEPDPATLARYAGTYYSPELDALYHVRVSESRLVASHVRHGDIPLAPAPDQAAAGTFTSDRWFFRNVRFTPGDRGSPMEMRVGGGRVRNLLFLRIDSPLPGTDAEPPDDPATAPPSVAERPFPPPTGPHPVGMAEYRWTDGTRPESFTKDPSDVRSIAVRAWYPTDSAAGSGALYIQDIAEFGDGQEFVPTVHVRTNATLNAPAASGPFPVLVYNHGGGWTRFTSTFTTEEMASHGYVVVSVGHNGMNKTLTLPDGGSVVPDTLTFPVLPGEDLYAEAIDVWAFLDEHYFPEWVADAAFVLDRLEEMNALGRFRGRLDLERIGMYGWSFGGALSIEMAGLDDRVKAAVNHDGQLFGAAPRTGIDKPFMLMHAGARPVPPPADGNPETAAANARALDRLMEEVARTDSSLFAASTASSAEWHDVTVAGANHGSFSDLVLFIPGASPEIDPARGHRIVNALTLAFFDRYLRDVHWSLLDDPSAEFPEVTATRR